MCFERKYCLISAIIAISLVFLCGSVMADEVDDRIYELNQILQAKDLPWTAERTSVSDLSPEERRALLGGPMEPLPVVSPTLDPSEEGGESPIPYPGGAQFQE